MKDKEIKYFIYARKSTEGEDRQSLSIPSQIEDDAKIQLREQLNVVDTITDSASAKIPFNRRNYSEMIKRIKKGEASGIIVWKVDRLARNHLEWGELMHLLQSGVILSIWTTQREYQSGDSALLIALEASMATQFSVDLSAIVKRGLEKKIAMGQPPLIARVGYLNTKHNERGANEIVQDPERWTLMRKTFDLMLTRQYTMRQIVTILNVEHNFRTRPSRTRLGAPLSISVLHRAFTDPFYSGYFYYKGTIHKGSYNAMITLEEFDIIQEILGRKSKPKPHKHDFAYTGFIKCGKCGCAITASKKLKHIKSTNEYKAYTWYHCTKRKGAANCPDKRYTTELEMQEMVENELKKIELSPKWKDFILEAIKEEYNEELVKHQELLQSIRGYEQKLLIELDRLLDLRISNDMPDEQYLFKKREREQVLIRVKEKYRRCEKNVNEWIEQVEGKLNFSEALVGKFISTDEKGKKRICMVIGQNWQLKANKLTFSRFEWFSDMQLFKDYFDKKKDRLDLINSYTDFKKTPYYKAVRSIGCGLREHIRPKSGETTANENNILTN